MNSYLKKDDAYYKNLKEWEDDYIPFLKHVFGEIEEDVNWCTDPYKDPDSKKTKSEEFYRAMTFF